MDRPREYKEFQKIDEKETLFVKLNMGVTHSKTKELKGD